MIPVRPGKLSERLLTCKNPLHSFLWSPGPKTLDRRTQYVPSGGGGGSSGGGGGASGGGPSGGGASGGGGGALSVSGGNAGTNDDFFFFDEDDDLPRCWLSPSESESPIPDEIKMKAVKCRIYQQVL